MLSKQDIQKELLQASLYDFVVFFWGTVVNTPYRDAPHIKKICDIVQSRIEQIGNDIPKESDLIVNLPPATSKSLIVSVFTPAWAWVKYPNLRILCASYNATKAYEFAVASRAVIESELYQGFWPIKLQEDQNTRGLFSNQYKGSRTSIGSDTPSIGGHYNLLICDDLQTQLNVISESERDRINRFATQVLGSRTGNNPATQFIYVMQRLHMLDLTAYLRDLPGNLYENICLPAEFSALATFPELYSEEGLLDPSRLSQNELNKKRILLGASRFSAEYNQAPMSNEGSILKAADFEIVAPSETTRPMHFFIDGAFTAKRANDPTAILACYLNEDNRLIVTKTIEIWADYTDLKKKIRDFVFDNGYTQQSIIHIEPKASGLPLIQDLKALGLNTKAALNPTKSKEERTLAISARIEAHRVAIVKGSWNQSFLDNVQGFSRHDDILDTLIMAVHELVKDKHHANYKARMGFIDMGAPVRQNKFSNFFLN